jgi:hypothetical protein
MPIKYAILMPEKFEGMAKGGILEKTLPLDFLTIQDIFFDSSSVFI